jgi:hypothetical protein
MTTTRRENFGVSNNSRIAKRYTIPASVNEAMKYGPPLSPKLRAQMVSATHNAAPSMYTLHSGLSLAEVLFTIFRLTTSDYRVGLKGCGFSRTVRRKETIYGTAEAVLFQIQVFILSSSATC